MSYLLDNYLTASKSATQWLETQPHSCNSGDGHMIYTPQGSKVDFCCALGANYNGIQNSFSLPIPDEEWLAERLCKITGMDKVKLLKTGSDACEAAVRLARGGNSTMFGVGSGYHGFGNTFIDDEKPGWGTTTSFYSKQDYEALVYHLEKTDLSYCIIEPFELDYSEQRIKQLKEIRKLCTKKGIVLIFDEVITFGRAPKLSVANYTGIQPDIIVGAKALGNGYPISFVAMNKDIADSAEGKVFISGTFFGEVSAIREANKTLDFMTDKRVQKLWDKGLCFQKKLNAITPELQLYGLPTRAIWKGKYILEFCQEMNHKGYLLHPKGWFLNHAHTPEVLNEFLKDARTVLKDCEAGRVTLIGKKPQPVFKRCNDE